MSSFACETGLLEIHFNLRKDENKEFQAQEESKFKD
jgi:hypothetical protein